MISSFGSVQLSITRMQLFCRYLAMVDVDVPYYVNAHVVVYLIYENESRQVHDDIKERLLLEDKRSRGI